MKLLLFFVVLFSGRIQAQQPLPHIHQKNQLSLLLDHSLSNGDKQLKTLDIYLNHQKVPEADIYQLAQDRMPCKIPDLNTVVAIPNSWNEKIGVPYKSNHNAIPNPVPVRKTYTYRAFTQRNK